MIEQALKKYAAKNNLPEAFGEIFAKIKPFKKDYASYSEKAIKKLLNSTKNIKFAQFTKKYGCV